MDPGRYGVPNRNQSLATRNGHGGEWVVLERWIAA
jgi:hypothetical protein